MKTRKLVVTSALPYANGEIHIGHLVEYIQTDIWVRYHKLRGNSCLYICADDAHGTPVMLRARKEGVEPLALTAAVQERHEADFRDFFIEFDQYHSTHSEENRQCATQVYERLRDGGYLTKRTIEQAYDPVENMFLPDRFIKGECPKCGTEDQYGDSCESCGATYAPTDLKNPISVVSGSVPIRKDSEHLFFQLGKFEGVLKQWIEESGLQDSVRNKLQEWFESGLKDWDISRDAPYWGFEIPDMPGKYFYVWLDAPIGYQASHLKWCNENDGSFGEVWDPGSDVELYHFIGKDISYFHNLFWPAMLHGAGYRTPTAVFVHGFLTVDGRKMSKSRGTFINARTYLEYAHPEALRYYYAAKLGAGVDDIDLALDDFVFRVNSDLVGKLINIASRCGSMLNKRYGSTLSEHLDNPELYERALSVREELGSHYEGRDFGRVVRAVAALADETNKYIDTMAPWALAKNEETFEQGRAVCSQAINQFRILITYLAPVVPRIAEEATGFFKHPLSWDALDQPLLGTEVAKYKPLMMRVDRKAVQKMVDEGKPEAEAKPAKKKKSKAKKEVEPPAEITIDEFMKIDLRVALVVNAEAVEGADKLLKLTLDDGKDGRTVFAGIKSHYSPEDLIGKQVVVVANLKPRKMRFGLSEGMVLAAGDGQPFIIGVDEGATPGMRVR
jgi:methionyl-tRNA synthetase